jgi:hypothetical protein
VGTQTRGTRGDVMKSALRVFRGEGFFIFEDTLKRELRGKFGKIWRFPEGGACEWWKIK